MTDIRKETTSTLRCADCGTNLVQFRERDAEEAEKVAAKHQCTVQVVKNARRLTDGHKSNE